jgi:hypothetical protein
MVKRIIAVAAALILPIIGASRWQGEARAYTPAHDDCVDGDFGARLQLTGIVGTGPAMDQAERWSEEGGSIGYGQICAGDNDLTMSFDGAHLNFREVR